MFLVKKNKGKYTIYVFLVKKNKGKYTIYVSKNTFKRHVDLLLTGEKGKRHYVLIKYFSTFMYDHTLHFGRKHFCVYCLQVFSKADISKSHVTDCEVMIPDYVRFKSH